MQTAGHHLPAADFRVVVIAGHSEVLLPVRLAGAHVAAVRLVGDAPVPAAVQVRIVLSKAPHH